MVRFFRDAGQPSRPFRRSREAERQRRRGELGSPLTLESLEPRLALAVAPGLADTVPPVVRSVSLPAAGTYGTDRALSFKVNFSEPVKVVGDHSTVTLPIEVGNLMREARYVSGSGTKTLTFRLNVTANDVDSDGIGVGRVNSAAIRDFDFNKPGIAPRIVDRAGNPASNAIPALNSSGIRVDAAGPVVVSHGGFVTAGRRVSLQVTFDEPVFVKGKPTVPVTIGGQGRSLAYAFGSGTKTLTFAVTVPKGASVAAPAFRSANGLPGEGILLPAGANLKDRLGNAVTPFVGDSGTILTDNGHADGNRVVLIGPHDELVNQNVNQAEPNSSPAIQPGPQTPGVGGIAPQAPLIGTLPPPVFSPAPFVLPQAVGGIVTLSGDITGDTTFRAGTVYLIDGEVHVRKFVTLTIEDGVEVRIRNGRKNFATITSRALIFDSGSSLVAKTVTFQAADAADNAENRADNGGVFFCGGTRVASKDDVASMMIGSKAAWSFEATCIVANDLGRKDPNEGDGDGSLRDDIDAVSLVGVIADEWKVTAVEINRSGDDGFDLTNSDIEMERVKVFNPTEDGINLSSSYLTITGRLEVDMTDAKAPEDREIFDFEVDSGPAMITVGKGAWVDIRGFWDSSPDDHRVFLRSSDMPAPYPPYARTLYAWKGQLVKGPAEIFSKSERR